MKNSILSGLAELEAQIESYPLPNTYPQRFLGAISAIRVAAKEFRKVCDDSERWQTKQKILREKEALIAKERARISADRQKKMMRDQAAIEARSEPLDEIDIT